MICSIRLVSLAFALWLLVSSAGAEVINFGSMANQFSIEFVEIGDPGNAADATGAPNPAGAVPYLFNMAKFEVSRDMITKASAAGNLGITMSDMTSLGGNGPNQPATGVSWNEAARFVNWLNSSEGFSPAYKFALPPGDVGYTANANIELWTNGDSGFDAANPFRNSNAQYFLPSVDEWYKAAYYDPQTDMYFDFPTGSDLSPNPVHSGTAADTAVFDQGSGNFPVVLGPADIFNAGGLSGLGIMGLGGNVFEWEETEDDLLNDLVSASRGARGGSWGADLHNLQSTDRLVLPPALEFDSVGFRVASLSSNFAVVPEPTSLALWTVAPLSALLWRKWGKKGTGKAPG